MFTIPTIISTIADIITVIDIALKYGGFLNKDVKNVIEKSQIEIDKQGDKLTSEQVNQIFALQIRSAIPNDEVIATTRSMANLFELLGSISESLKYFEEVGRIAEYGTVLQDLIIGVNEKIDSWGCYEKWAIDTKPTQEMRTHGNRSVSYFLQAPNTTRYFWSVKELSTHVNWRLRNVNLNFSKEYMSFDHNRTHSIGLSKSFEISNELLWHKSVFGICRVSATPYQHGINLHDRYKFKNKFIKLNNVAITNLISATIGDFHYYSLKVNSEFAQSNSIAEVFNNQKKAG